MVPQSVCRCLSTAIWAVVLTTPLCAADRWPEAYPAVTERQLYGIPDTFHGATPTRAGNGSITFIAGAFTGVFRWDGLFGIRRIIQLNDDLPGFRNSVATRFSNLVGNERGHSAFLASFSQKGEGGRAGVFLSDGLTIRKVAASDEPAPGAGGYSFQNFSAVAINDNDQVAFLAAVHPTGLGPQGIFLGSPGSAPLRIAFNRDPAPGAGSGVYGGLQLLGINAAGQVAYLAGINGGTISYGLYLGSASGSTLIAASGSAVPGIAGATFSLRSTAASYSLNSEGKVAFQSDVAGGGNTSQGIWIGSAQTTPVKVATDSDSTPAGGVFGPMVLRGYSDAGKVLFDSQPAGAGTTHALYLKDAAAAATVVFARGQSRPGGAGTFDTTQTALVNASGTVAFLASLTGPAPYGWFMRTGTNAATAVAVEGEPAPSGGRYGLGGRLTAGILNAAGQLVYTADLLGVNEEAVFLWTAGRGSRTVVTSMEHVPRGDSEALLSYFGGGVMASLDHLYFIAGRGGARVGIYSKPLAASAPVREIVSDGALFPGGGKIHSMGLPQVNLRNEVAGQALLIVGAASYPARAVYVHTPSAGLRKVAMTGEAAPGGGSFTSFSSIIPINNRGLVAFYASVSGNAANPRGIFAGTPGGPISAIARAGDSSPIGGTFTTFTQPLYINDAGQVAFRAVVQDGPAQRTILCVGRVGAAPVKVVAQGDVLPGGTVASVAEQFRFNEAGEVAYLVTFTTSARGLFLGSAGGVQKKVALLGDAVPGVTGTVVDLREATLVLNSRGQVGFWAAVGSMQAARSGYFLGSGVAAPQVRLLEGQALPGGGVCGIVFPEQSVIAMNDAGEMAMQVGYVDGSPKLPRLVIASSTGVLRAFANAGQTAFATGSEYAHFHHQLYTTPAGKFVFFASLVDGPVSTGYFWNDMPGPW